MFHNVVIGKPIVNIETLLATDKKDWEENEKEKTLFTETRFLPAIMKEAGIVQSTGEVRRNKPELMITLDKPERTLSHMNVQFVAIKANGWVKN